MSVEKYTPKPLNKFASTGIFVCTNAWEIQFLGPELSILWVPGLSEVHVDLCHRPAAGLCCAALCCAWP